MNEVFITKIIYKNIPFDIYLNNKEYEIRCLENNVNENIIEEFKEIILSKWIMNDKKIKPSKIILPSTIVFSLGVFLGVILNKNIDKIKIEKQLDIDIDTMQSTLLEDENIIDFDEDLFLQYITAIYSNPNLSDDDKKEFVKRFNYVNKNKEYFDIDELLKTLKTIVIKRYSFQKKYINGDFVIEDGIPTINMYKNSDYDTLIHEMYHAIKHNKYYWDTVYFYENRFINSDEYDLLSKEEKKQCEIENVLGNMLEEAHTSILTAEENNTDNININYRQEVYIYKMYERIFGHETMEQNMLSSNKVKGFLNSLLSVGCTKEEAIAITTRLDIFNKFTSKDKETQDLSYIKYQICDDLAYVYNKKYKNIDDTMLNITILNLIYDIDMNKINNIQIKYNMPELLAKINNKEIAICNYFDEQTNKDYAIEYGVNRLYIDYFSKEFPLLYVRINNFNTIVLSVSNEDVAYYDSIINLEDSKYIYDLYDDYYEFALNQYGNDNNYACFFACIYANDLLNVDQKSEFLNYYNIWEEASINEEEAKKILLFANSDKIENIFYYISQNQNKEKSHIK